MRTFLTRSGRSERSGLIISLVIHMNVDREGRPFCVEDWSSKQGSLVSWLSDMTSRRRGAIASSSSSVAGGD